MAFFQKIGKWIGFDDEKPDSTNQDYVDDPTESDENTNVAANSLKGNKVVSIKSGLKNSKSKIVLYEPRVYSDAKDVAQNLLQDHAVVINFNRMEDSSARRVVDFVTGTVYALNGQIQRVGDKIFLATPPKFETDGKISELVDKKDSLS